jgi:protein SCO1/2
LLLLAAGCSKALAPAPPAETHAEVASHDHVQHAHAHEHQLLPGAEPSANSLYQLQAALRDQDGDTIGLDHFRGHVVLTGMFYSSCTNICPMLVARVKTLEQQLDPEARKQVKVLLVSLDPARDDPAALKRLATTHAVDQPSWRFVVGSEDTTREIAAALGIRYRGMASGEINHTPVLAVLDAEGNVQSRTEDFGDAAPLLAAMVKLAK